VVSSNLEGRTREAEKAEELVMQEVATYLQWENSLDAVPTIVELREKVDGIRQRELDKTLDQLPDLTEAQRSAVETMSMAIVNKIMHAPIVVLKQTAADPNGNTLLGFARKIFNLDKELKRPQHEKGAGVCGKDDQEKAS
jgi:glutamyl-tRNA reductase